MKKKEFKLMNKNLKRKNFHKFLKNSFIIILKLILKKNLKLIL